MNDAANVALYATVWGAVFLFAAAQAGQGQAAAASDRGWPWMAWTIGAALMIAHVAIAFDARHAWQHASAAHAVVEQSRAVYGIAWSGGVWMNYVFVAAWAAESCWWGAAPQSYGQRPRSVLAASRVFYLLMLVNAAIVFAAPSRRWAGLIVVAWLIWQWRDTFKAPARKPARRVQAGAGL